MILSKKWWDLINHDAPDIVVIQDQVGRSLDRGTVYVLYVADAAQIRGAISAAARIGFTHVQGSDLTRVVLRVLIDDVDVRAHHAIFRYPKIILLDHPKRSGVRDDHVLDVRQVPLTDEALDQRDETRGSQFRFGRI